MSDKNPNLTIAALLIHVGRGNVMEASNREIILTVPSGEWKGKYTVTTKIEKLASKSKVTTEGSLESLMATGRRPIVLV